MQMVLPEDLLRGSDLLVRQGRVSTDLRRPPPARNTEQLQSGTARLLEEFFRERGEFGRSLLRQVDFWLVHDTESVHLDNGVTHEQDRHACDAKNPFSSSAHNVLPGPPGQTQGTSHTSERATRFRVYPGGSNTLRCYSLHLSNISVHQGPDRKQISAGAGCPPVLGATACRLFP
jgi:hypothetical protein